jgi:L-lysine 2,3-aminomutase
MAVKRCVACGEVKDETEFPWWSEAEGHRRGTCRACKSKQQKKWYAKKRESHIANVKSNIEHARSEAHQFVRDYLSTQACVDCGESNPIVLEFDHVRGQKRMAISEMCTRGYSPEAIMLEIEKCVVRCGNCHRRKTSNERGWFRL